MRRNAGALINDIEGRVSEGPDDGSEEACGGIVGGTEVSLIFSEVPSEASRGLFAVTLRAWTEADDSPSEGHLNEILPNTQSIDGL